MVCICKQILNSQGKAERDQARLLRVKEASVYCSDYSKRKQTASREAEERQRKKEKIYSEAEKDFDLHRKEYEVDNKD